MSYSLYLCRFVGGDPAPMDEAAVRDVLDPVTLAGTTAASSPHSPEFRELETEDGGTVDVYGDARGLTFHRPSPGRVLNLVAELARRTGAVVVPDGRPAILTTEADRRHLPKSLWAEAIVVPPPALTGQAISLAISPQPEPRRRPILPQFPYHPNPVATGSVTASDEPCVCCGQERGWVYTGPVYAADAPDAGICPYCIASGTAADRYDACFGDTIEGDVSRDVVIAILTRTPGFTAWQSPHWLTHCGDGAAFLGPAGTKELTAYPDAVDHLRRQCAEWKWPPDQVENLLGALDKDGGPTAYLFRCRVCEAHLAYADFT
ncbi:CbrC family protein [Streptomyces prunicolor]|uniref:CbrC family protein n=1 Tax=Streptomyces prunicolor TaxID=67348 RepID=UPI00371773C1